MQTSRSGLSNISTTNVKRRPTRSLTSPVDVDEDPLTPTDMSYQRALTPTRPKSLFGDTSRNNEVCTRILYIIVALIIVAIVGVIVLVIHNITTNDQNNAAKIHEQMLRDRAYERHGDPDQHKHAHHHHQGAHHYEPPPEQHVVEEEHVPRNEEENHVQHKPVHHVDFNDPDMVAKRDAIKSAFLFGWGGYERFAFGHDELRPITNDYRDNFGGFGSTIIDAIDTMLLMGLENEYQKCKSFVSTLDFKKNQFVSLFEFTIRYLGGLLGAYELSKDAVFLNKAKELGDMLIPAFNTKSGIPYTQVNLETGESKNADWHRTQSILSEIGSLQLEFKYLSYHTNNPIYAEKADAVLDLLFKQPKTHTGLFPNYISTEEGTFAQEWYSLGALGDSFYEYLLKHYLLTHDLKYWTMYRESVHGIKRWLVARSQPSGWTYISEYRNGQQVPKFDHLVCFVPGMLALGYKYAPMNSGTSEAELEEDLQLARELMETCAHLYFDQATGIAPEIVNFGNHTHDYNIQHPTYLLRPESLESLFVLYRVTRDVKYQQWAWQIFQNIQVHCKVGSGFSGLKHVDDLNAPEKHDNAMESFFLAETLKYLYLIFSPDDVAPLDKYVINTEGHLLSLH